MILLFGPAGAGKSQQGQLMAEKHGWKWLSTGQIFRDSNDAEVKRVLASGELMSDELTFGVLDMAVERATKEGFPKVILDGFPRTPAQAEWLVDYAEREGQPIERIIILEVTNEELIKRLSLRGRAEDTPVKVKRRMEIYRQDVEEIINYLAFAGLIIVRVDGVGSIEEVQQRIEDEIAGVSGADAEN